MKVILFGSLILALSLQGEPISLSTFLKASETSDAAKALEAHTAMHFSAQRNSVLSDGFQLYGELDYASAKEDERNKIEYHVAVEKQLLLGDSDRYLDALTLSAKQQKMLKINQLKSIVFEHYINACTFEEKIDLLKDAQDRNIQLTMLIKEGVEGGEFDRSALLRSELVVDELELGIHKLKSQYKAARKRLHIYLKDRQGKPLCEDLPSGILLFDNLEENAVLYRQLESDIAATSAMKQFKSTTVQEMTLGIGYDNEMDVSRGLVFMQIPLTAGSRLENERESARLAELSARQQLMYVKTEMDAELNVYTKAQKTRRHTLRRLNNHLIPKAYEATVLLQERFMGSEGSYLAYIESQTMLFELLLRGVDTLSNALLAQARLYRTMGIDPQKDIK